MMNEHEKYMKAALKQAEIAKKYDEVPIGAVIVKDGKIIARGHNLKEKKKNAIYHAEMVAITKAVKKIGNWNLKDCAIYVTLEPCLMCTGALIQSRIGHIYYGTNDPKGGAIESVVELKKIKGINHYPNTSKGLLQEECSNILKEFFRKKREDKK